MSGVRYLFLSGSAVCAACLLASCASDVPVPDDPKAQEWSPAIKSSYSSWQPPKSMPKGNAEYEKAIDKAQEARRAPVVPAPEKKSAAALTAAPAKKAAAPAPEKKSAAALTAAPAKKAAEPAPEKKSAAALTSAPVKKAVEPAPEKKKDAAASASAKKDEKKTETASIERKKYTVDRSAKASEYEVVKGDSLSLISKKHYKDGNLWYIIYQENKAVLKNNANKLRPGMKLKLPVVKQDTGAH